MEQITKIPRTICLILIRIYQWAISPFFANRCRFYPSCSNYALEAIETHGVIKGFYLIFKRLLRCQPFCAGGVDLVPELSHKRDLL